MNTNFLFAALCSVTFTGLTTAFAEPDPKQPLTEKTWDLVGWSAKGDITKNMEFLPTVYFKDGKVGGNAGINGFDGHYQALADGSLVLREIAVTQMGGPRELHEMEETYLRILLKCSRWSIEDDTLILSDGTDENQLRYKTGIRKIDRPLKHQEWELVGVQVIDENGRSLTALGDGEITLKIGDGDVASGSTGVNGYSAKAELGEGNKFALGAMRMTMRGAADPEYMANEKEYLDLLNIVTQWEIAGRYLTLSNEDKSCGLVFEAKD